MHVVPVDLVTRRAWRKFPTLPGTTVTELPRSVCRMPRAALGAVAGWVRRRDVHRRARPAHDRRRRPLPSAPGLAECAVRSGGVTRAPPVSPDPSASSRAGLESPSDGATPVGPRCSGVDASGLGRRRRPCAGRRASGHLSGRAEAFDPGAAPTSVAGSSPSIERVGRGAGTAATTPGKRCRGVAGRDRARGDRRDHRPDRDGTAQPRRRRRPRPRPATTTIALVPIVGFWSPERSDHTGTAWRRSSPGRTGRSASRRRGPTRPRRPGQTLGLDLGATVTTASPDGVLEAVRGTTDTLGIVRAADVRPSVRALAVDGRSLFGNGRVRSIEEWPLTVSAARDARSSERTTRPSTRPRRGLSSRPAT